MRRSSSLARRALRIAGLSFLSFVLLLSAVWASGALWFQLPAPSLARQIAAAAAVLAMLWVLVGLWRGRYRPLLVYGVAYGAMLVWWSMIAPSNDRVWAEEMAQSLTYERSGDTITIHNVRNFDWTSLTTEAAARWETRTYNLSELTGVDVAVLYWAGPMIGHTYLEFGFRDGRYLSVSIEIRKERGEAHSSIAGFFKAYELAVIAGDERDFIGWRIHDPSQNVQLFRTRTEPWEAQALLLALLDKANALAATPEFYNTLTDNCTTVVWSLSKAMGDALPADYRILLSGYLPDYLYDLGRLNTAYPLDELRRRGEIMPRAGAAVEAGLTGPEFSAALREGVPEAK
jgi:hypothetical protein